MWRAAAFRRHTCTAVLCLGLVMLHLVGRGSIVRVLSQPGEAVTLPCEYHYEDLINITQLSVQWRNPHNGLLCHYIKHKSFQNCSAGYSISYAPGRIALSIQTVRTEDAGTHLCSVSKPHEFSDVSIELVLRTKPSISPPTSSWEPTGDTNRLIVLQLLAVMVCM